MSDLPVNIDSTYADDGSDATVALHQQHHDALHALYNDLLGTDAAGGTALLQALLDGTYAPLTQSLNAQTGTTYTAVAGDRGKLVTLTNVAAIAVTLPTPTSLGLAAGDQVDFAVLGAGMATFGADTGATVNGTPSLVTRAQYSVASAKALSTTAWLVYGDLASP